jgi:hypothetical protein
MIIDETKFFDKNNIKIKEFDIVKCYPHKNDTDHNIEIGIVLKTKENGCFEYIYRLNTLWYGKNRLSSYSYGKWSYTLFDFDNKIDSKYVEVIGNALLNDIDDF